MNHKGIDLFLSKIDQINSTVKITTISVFDSRNRHSNIIQKSVCYKVPQNIL